MYKEFPILYKKSNLKDHINQWQIIIDNNSYYTISGYVGGKLFKGDKTFCYGKNVGKSNQTTDQEQTLLEVESLYKKRLDIGFWEDINKSHIPKIFTPMTAHDYVKRKKYVEFPIISQAKLDGVRCIVKADGMWSRNGKSIISTPHIFRELEKVFKRYPEAIFDGELFTSNKNVDFNTIISCVRKTKPKPEDIELSRQYIEYHVYDMPSVVGEEETFEDRYFNLFTIIEEFQLNNKIRLVKNFVLNSHQDIQDQLGIYLQVGYEGQILRDPQGMYKNKKSTGLLKHKNFVDREFEILDINEGIGKYAGKAATITILAPNGEKTYPTINGTMKYLEEVLQNKDKLIGKLATVKYFERTPPIYDENNNIIGGNSLRFPKCIQLDRFDV